ncbi:hypothetical protein COV19_07110 [Candidatus Woesearchaeota archaeon CG10_big_fil_rev_8_21_14_0_10_44_13]|nr:MAG: hypothetical protein COV19_07110 [Candidatus Woesearchaeota archaeon CG10_big_fil_rev_8_21_14_0_10_44_13]
MKPTIIFKKVFYKKLWNAINIAYYHSFNKEYVNAYPLYIFMDPGNVCNLKCPLCPTGQGDRGMKRGFLKYSLFKRVMGEIGDYSLFLFLYNWGEPFLNKDLFRFIKLSRKKLVIPITSSNLTTLDRNSCKQLVRSGLWYLIVSLDGLTQETYQKYRIGGDLNKVLKNVRLINYYKTRYGIKRPKIICQFIVNKYNEHEVDTIKKQYIRLGFDKLLLSRVRSDLGKGVFEDNTTKLKKYRDWFPSNKEYKLYLKNPKNCKYLNVSSAINFDGGVFPCCLIYGDNHTFGNISNQSFFSVWNGPNYLTARRMIFKRKDITSDLVCSNCLKNKTFEEFNGFHFFLNMILPNKIYDLIRKPF